MMEYALILNKQLYAEYNQDDRPTEIELAVIRGRALQRAALRDGLRRAVGFFPRLIKRALKALPGDHGTPHPA